jgi:GNAT superfamily N-acetyltransferase
MAVDTDVQGQGVGAKVLALVHEVAKAQGYSAIWCNARTSALGFYTKQGWECLSEEFDIPDVGPHYKMQRSLG